MDWGKSPLAHEICEILDDKKALDIIALDISNLTVVADYFIICSARTSIAVRALCEDIQAQIQKSGLHPRRVEGQSAGRWIVIDYGDVVVHIFHLEEREFYRLESLWMRMDNFEAYGTEKSDVSA